MKFSNMSRRDFIKKSSAAALTVSALSSATRAAPGFAPVRVAQIGIGHSHAARKWETLQQYPDALSPVGIWEPDAELRKQASTRPPYQNTRWLEPHEIFDDPGVEGVLVQPEFSDIHAMGLRSLHAGKHVHLEKPHAPDLAGFQQLQDLARRNNRVLQMGYMYRYHPAFQFCVRAAREGWLGRIFAVHGEMSSDINPARRPNLTEVYGGSMMMLGCHLLDIVVAILGEPKHVNAYSRQTFPEKDALRDHEIAVLEYPNGLATIRNMLAEIEARLRRQLILCGENGTIELLPLEPAKLRLSLTQPAGGFEPGTHRLDLPALPGRYDEQLLDFARLVRGQSTSAPEFTAAHDLAGHRTLLKAAGRLPA